MAGCPSSRIGAIGISWTWGRPRCRVEPGPEAAQQPPRWLCPGSVTPEVLGRTFADRRSISALSCTVACSGVAGQGPTARGNTGGSSRAPSQALAHSSTAASDCCASHAQVMWQAAWPKNSAHRTHALGGTWSGSRRPHSPGAPSAAGARRTGPPARCQAGAAASMAPADSQAGRARHDLSRGHAGPSRSVTPGAGAVDAPSRPPVSTEIPPEPSPRHRPARPTQPDPQQFSTGAGLENRLNTSGRPASSPPCGARRCGGRTSASQQQRACGPEVVRVGR